MFASFNSCAWVRHWRSFHGHTRTFRCVVKRKLTQTTRSTYQQTSQPLLSNSLSRFLRKPASLKKSRLHKMQRKCAETITRSRGGLMLHHHNKHCSFCLMCFKMQNRNHFAKGVLLRLQCHATAWAMHRNLSNGAFVTLHQSSNPFIAFELCDDPTAMVDVSKRMHVVVLPQVCSIGTCRSRGHYDASQFSNANVQ